VLFLLGEKIAGGDPPAAPREFVRLD